MMPVKGLLKGLRYISQIFDNEKEEEIQIGFPTDVKHVAHIGMDGPSANTPSWMNKYNPNAETSPAKPNSELKQKLSTKSLAEEAQKPSNAPFDSLTKRSSSKTKHSRRDHSSNSSGSSWEGDSFNLSKPRRHKHSGDMGSPSERPRRHKHSGDMGSPTSERPRRHKHSGDMGSPTSERPRRHKHSGDFGSPTSEHARRLQSQNTGSDSPSENAPRIPKSHRKKSKGISGSGLMKSPRSKEPDPFPETSPYSDPDPDPRPKDNEVHPTSVYEEGNEYEEISRGIRAL